MFPRINRKKTNSRAFRAYVTPFNYQQTVEMKSFHEDEKNPVPDVPKSPRASSCRIIHVPPSSLSPRGGSAPPIPRWSGEENERDTTLFAKVAAHDIPGVEAVSIARQVIGRFGPGEQVSLERGHHMRLEYTRLVMRCYHD